MDRTLPFSEKFSTEVLSLLRNAVLVTDPEGAIRFSCAETEVLLEHPPHELAGKPVEILFLPEDRKVLLPNIMKITRKKGSFRGEALLAARAGQSLYSHISTHRLSLGNGTGDWILWTIHDISRIKEIEKSSQSLENLSVLGRMTEKVVHEIRRHLLSLSGFAARFEGAFDKDHPLLPYVRPLQEEILSLESVLGQVEAFATMPIPDYRKEDLLDTVQLLVAELQPLAAAKGASLHLKSGARPGSTLLYMDPDLILWAIRDLIRMQIESLGPGSQLGIHLSEEDSSFVLHMEDSRPAAADGLSPNGSQNAFLSESSRNANLRLALVARIVEEHGGELEFRQNSQRGTVVRVRLTRDRRQKARMRAI